MPIFNASLTFSFLPHFSFFPFFMLSRLAHSNHCCCFSTHGHCLQLPLSMSVAKLRTLSGALFKVAPGSRSARVSSRYFSLCSNCSFSVAAAASCSGRCTVHARRRLEGTGALWMQQRGHVANIKSTLVSLQ